MLITFFCRNKVFLIIFSFFFIQFLLVRQKTLKRGVFFFKRRKKTLKIFDQGCGIDAVVLRYFLKMLFKSISCTTLFKKCCPCIYFKLCMFLKKNLNFSFFFFCMFSCIIILFFFQPQVKM